MRDRTRRGDWLVRRDELERAEDSFSHRGRADRAADRLMRQPIEPNRERWEPRQGRFDYPGVDTPTKHPRYSLSDASHEARNVDGRRTKRDAVLDRQPEQEMRGSTMLGSVMDSSNELGRAFGRAMDELR